MNTSHFLTALYRVASWIASHIILFVTAVATLSLIWPASFLWIGTGTVSPLLGIVMFGMGLTLRLSDFKPVVRHPRQIIVGELAQFIIMPSVAWLLCRIFSLPPELALGVILVGCSPGGTASNVICYLAKGDVALSVAMTGVSTLLSPVLTPLLVMFLAGEAVDVDLAGMFISIVQVVLVPVILGLAVNHFFSKVTGRIVPLLPMMSTLAIALIIGVIISHNAASILQCSLLVGAVVIIHNVTGLCLGYAAGKLCRIAEPQRIAISIEVGMQNSGLATSLAATHFAMFPMTAVPGAIFSVWHNISGSVFAQIFARRRNKSESIADLHIPRPIRD